MSPLAHGLSIIRRHPVPIVPPLHFHVRSTTPFTLRRIACVQTCIHTIESTHTQRFDHFSSAECRFLPTLYHPSSKTRVFLLRFLPFLVRKETSRVPRFV